MGLELIIASAIGALPTAILAYLSWQRARDAAAEARRAHETAVRLQSTVAPLVAIVPVVVALAEKVEAPTTPIGDAGEFTGLVDR